MAAYMVDYLILAAGVVCAAIGGELFVRGSVGLAGRLGISPGIIGATVAAFATSAPELSVSVSAAVSGDPAIGLGDSLGSNVVNISLILGIVLMMAGMQVPRDTLRRDFPAALLVPAFTWLLVFDGSLSRADGMTLLCIFAVWFIATVMEAKKQRSATENVAGEKEFALTIVFSLAGLILLFLAGKLVVSGARAIAMSFGIDEFIIGATIVAAGTSVPELATAVIARVKNHDEVGLGTIFGSNLMNGLFIAGITAVITPIPVNPHEAGIALFFGSLSVGNDMAGQKRAAGKMAGRFPALPVSALDCPPPSTGMIISFCEAHDASFCFFNRRLLFMIKKRTIYSTIDSTINSAIECLVWTGSILRKISGRFPSSGPIRQHW
jgi:cation:H+ antiporter